MTKHCQIRPRLNYVVRVSELDYFLEICKQTHSVSVLTADDVAEIVVRKRVKIEKERPAVSSTRLYLPTLEKKIAQDYLRKGAVKDVLKLCTSWNLLVTGPNGKFEPSPICREIGAFVSDEEIASAKNKLFHAIIASGMDRLFDPSRFLLKIRDNVVQDVIAVDRDRQHIRLKVPSEEGVAYDDERFVRDIMHTNPVSFTVICDWAYFFNLLNFFIPTFEKTVKRPTKGIYPTKIIVSLKEVNDLIKLLSAEHHPIPKNLLIAQLGLTGYVGTCLVYIAEKLGLVIEENDNISIVRRISDLSELIRLATGRGITVISDGKIRGIINKFDKELENDTTYLILEPQWPLEDFLETLWECYYDLVDGKTFLFASIFRLRETVCKILRIHDDDFDEYVSRALVKYPSRLHLGLGSAETKHRLKARRFQKPFNIHGRSYYVVKVTGDHVE